jgi:antitoxin ParD1/3/4
MTMKVSLPGEFGAFVDRQVTSGRYATAGDVVCDALQMLKRKVQADAERVAWLQQAYREGIESGDHGPLDVDALIAEARAMQGRAAE